MKDIRLLITEILSGNTHRFQTIIEEYERLVSHIVFRMVHNTSDHEDLCQDIFIKVFHHLSSFKFESKFSTWIAQIAYNTCINHLEKKKVKLFHDLTAEEQTLESYADDTISPDQFTERADISRRLQTEIAELPLQFRTILTLFHLDEMSYRDIAAIMDLPEGTVKSYLFRARRLLKDRLLRKYQQEKLWH